MKNMNSLKGFPQDVKGILKEILKSQTYSGMLPEEEVKKISKIMNLPEEKFLLEIMKIARDFALPEISNFNVGAIALGASGSIYFGANQEFPGTSMNFTLHAEQAALSNAFLHGEKGVRSITVNYIPCCLCRQFMLELENASDLKIILPDKSLTLKELVPYPFGPADLGVKARLMKEGSNSLEMKEVTEDQVALEAFDAADKSYSPYSNSFSGVALLLKDGRIIQGRYIENAAYNISMNPMTAALSFLNMHGLDYNSIDRAVIVEPKKNIVSQRKTAKVLLKAVNDEVVLEVVKLR